MEGRRTVNLGKLQALRVLNFIRFECVIVKVKSEEMTALSKSNGDQDCGRPEENSLWVEMGPSVGAEERKAFTPTLALLCGGCVSSTVLATGQCALLRVGAHSGRRKKRRTRKNRRLKMSTVLCDGPCAPRTSIAPACLGIHEVPGSVSRTKIKKRKGKKSTKQRKIKVG